MGIGDIFLPKMVYFTKNSLVSLVKYIYQLLSDHSGEYSAQIYTPGGREQVNFYVQDIDTVWPWLTKYWIRGDAEIQIGLAGGLPRIATGLDTILL